MCKKNSNIRTLVLLEGQVKWIMERETPAERLAAWETIVSIAFPNEYELPYTPPDLPSDGTKLSIEDRARRDTFHMVKDFLGCNLNELLIEKGSTQKDKKKVEAGRLGALIRYGYGDSSDTSVESESDDMPPQTAEELTNIASGETTLEQYPIARQLLEETPFGGVRRREGTLSLDDKKRIAEWNKKIPNAAALKEWLERSYMMGNRDLVCSLPFCEYAYWRLAKESNWISSKTGKPLRNLHNPIHWMAIDYVKKVNQIKRAAEEEHRADMESDFANKQIQAVQMSSEEMAAIDRRRRKQAEKEAMEKIMRGEL